MADEDAVSPVIGVILMVAVTVILAAVIGAFVLDLGESQESPHRAGWEWDQNKSASQADSTGEGVQIELTHKSGDTVERNSVKIVVDGEDVTTASGSATYWEITNGFGSEITSGSSVTIETTSNFANENEIKGSTFRLVWADEIERDTATLAEYTVE